MSYQEKLLDPRWQKKRLQILERDGFACQECFSTTDPLDVHHKIYSEGDPWDIDDKHLITLCKECHKTEQEALGRYWILFRDTLKSAGFLADDIRELASGVSLMEFQHLPAVVASAYSFAFSNPEIQQFLIEKYFDHLAKKNNG